MNRFSPVSGWKLADTAADPLAEIRRLGLEKNVAELDAYGFTIVPPDQAGPPGLADKIRQAMVDVAARRSGVAPDLESGETHRDKPRGVGQHMYYLLLEGEAFEEALVNPTALALVTYLLGDSCLLSSMTGMLKGPGGDPLPLHADMGMFPGPWSAASQVCNATYALTDYSRENGSLCFWPGSHKFARRPTPAEMAAVDEFMPAVAPAGSLIVWHGNTWHGAFARTAPGVRINLIMYFVRGYVQTQEWYRDKVSPETLARRPRIRDLLGLDNPYPMAMPGNEGPDEAHYQRLGNAVLRNVKNEGQLGLYGDMIEKARLGIKADA